MIYIQTHHTRDYSDVYIQLSRQGAGRVIASVDRTDYYSLSKDHPQRYRGVCENQIAILKNPDPDDWKIVVHDDLVFRPEALHYIRHVLTFAPKRVINFYHPTNKAYRTAWERGHHVLRTYSNTWCHVMAFPTKMCAKYVEWYETNVIKGSISEDAVFNRFMTRNKYFVYAVMPSAAQHTVYTTPSVFGNPYKVGKNVRTSFTYSEPVDYLAIDWKSEFENPYKDDKKQLSKKGLQESYLASFY